MSTARRRGISDHLTAQTLETARIHPFREPISRLDRDRLGVVLCLMLASPLCTAAEAIEAADRLFPLPREGEE